MARQFVYPEHSRIFPVFAARRLRRHETRLRIRPHQAPPLRSLRRIDSHLTHRFAKLCRIAQSERHAAALASQRVGAVVAALGFPPLIAVAVASAPLYDRLHTIAATVVERQLRVGVHYIEHALAHLHKFPRLCGIASVAFREEHTRVIGTATLRVEHQSVSCSDFVDEIRVYALCPSPTGPRHKHHYH